MASGTDLEAIALPPVSTGLTQTRIVIIGEYTRDSAATVIDERNAFSQAYFETHFRVDTPGHEWPEKFVIISACATTGESWTEEETAAADRNLLGALHARGEWLARVIGFSPTTRHSEPIWAVDVPADEACRIGLLFRQDAIYEVDHDDLFVLSCKAPGVRARVGSFRQRLEAGASSSTA